MAFTPLFQAHSATLKTVQTFIQESLDLESGPTYKYTSYTHLYVSLSIRLASFALI